MAEETESEKEKGEDTDSLPQPPASSSPSSPTSLKGYTTLAKRGSGTNIKTGEHGVGASEDLVVMNGGEVTPQATTPKPRRVSTDACIAVEVVGYRETARRIKNGYTTYKIQFTFTEENTKVSQKFNIDTETSLSARSLAHGL